ncbi:unnamed protein product [Calypogeia fissa]
MGSTVSTYVLGFPTPTTDAAATGFSVPGGDKSASCSQCNNKNNNNNNEEMSLSLLPGLPDEITISHILTRLHWNKVYLLASLNRGWRDALKSRDVYEARLRAKCTQTLVAMIHDDPANKYRNYVNALSVYDSIKNSWHLLPRIPTGLSGIPEECCCVSLRGTLYIIGGRGRGPLLRDEVYAFDLIGQPGWKQCASMITGRAAFACEAKDGKIYVFGGMGAQAAAEVYDPEQDVWTGIAPMLSTRMHHKVVNIGGEFYVQLGKILGRNHRSDTLPIEVYNSRKDCWRKVENFNLNTSAKAVMAETMVVIDGKVHKIVDDVLYVFDETSRVWKVTQSISWDVFDQQRGNNRTLPFADAASALAVNGELLALVYGRTAEGYMELTPLKSEGLGVKNQKLVWKRIQCSLGFLHSHSMCAIDL